MLIYLLTDQVTAQGTSMKIKRRGQSAGEKFVLLVSKNEEKKQSLQNWKYKPRPYF